METMNQTSSFSVWGNKPLTFSWLNETPTLDTNSATIPTLVDDIKHIDTLFQNDVLTTLNQDVKNLSAIASVKEQKNENLIEAEKNDNGKEKENYTNNNLFELENNEIINRFEDDVLELTSDLAIHYSMNPISNKGLLKYLLSHNKHRKHFTPQCLNTLSLDVELFNLLYDFLMKANKNNTDSTNASIINEKDNDPLKDFCLQPIPYYTDGTPISLKYVYEIFLNLTRKGYQFNLSTLQEAVFYGYGSLLWQIFVNLKRTDQAIAEQYIDSIVRLKCVTNLEVLNTLSSIQENFFQTSPIIISV